MAERPETDLVLSLPEDLTPEQLRFDVRPWLALNNRSKSQDRKKRIRHFGFCFRPQVVKKRILIDCAMVQRATATGICELMALLDWLKAEGSLPINIHAPTRLASLGLDQRLNPSEDPLAAFPLPPRRIIVPVWRPVGTDDGQAHRSALMEIARKLASDLTRALPEVDHAFFEKTTLEFFREGLLNAYEHGFALSKTGGSVWIAVSRLPIDALVDSCWEQWQSRFASGADSVLELAIADSGAGVPEMLADAYGALKNAVKSGHSTEFHDAILEYALSPFGTRKFKVDHASATLRQGYRGLYRILHHTEALSGQTLLRSGLGLYGYGYSGSDTMAVRASDLRMIERSGKAYNATSGLPGTTLSMRAVLPLPERLSRPRSKPGDQATGYSFSCLSAPTSLWSQPSWSIDKYVADFNFGMKENVAHIKNASSQDLHLTAIIHPGCRVTGNPETSSRELWNAAALMMAENTHPHFVPIHFFFDVPQDDLFLAHKTFWSICTERQFEIPAICGLHAPHNGQLYWFVFVPGHQRASLKLSSERETLAKQPEEWWQMFEGAYPKVVSIDHSTDGARLRLNLPDGMSRTSQTEALSYMVRQLADTRSASWYWRAGENEKTLVRTRSGKLVRHYVTAFALCLNEPVVEMAVVSLLDIHVSGMIAAGHNRIIMVPDDTSEASYILAKRLRSRLNAREKVEVTHAGHLRSARKQGDGILAFTDAIHTSERISIRIKKQSEVGLRPDSVFACLDLRQPEASWSPDLPPLVSLIRWSLPQPENAETVTAEYTMVTIDALTHEMLPAGNALERHPSHRYYNDLAWRNSCNPFPEPELLSRLRVAPEQVTFPEDVLPYGLQHVDERLHIVKFRMSKALEAADFRDQVARWLAAVISSILQPKEDRDVVFFCRDDCGVAKYQSVLAEEALRFLKEIGRPLKGVLWVAPLPAARKGMRPLLSHHPSTRTQGARAISLLRRNQAQLGLQQSSVRDGYVALFVDSACASGRTIRDFLLPMAEIDLQPRPGRLAVCPLVSRLPAMEEKILLRTHHLSTGWGNLRPNEKNTRKQLPLDFAALLQLRTPAYARTDLMPGLSKLRNLLAHVDESWHADMQKWKSGVEQHLDYLEDHVTKVESCPLYVGSALRDIAVSQEALLIRQLLSLHQEGLPVISPLVNRLRERSIVEKDHSLLAVLALEPDLLDDDVLNGSFRDDIAALALHALDRSVAPLRSCALWVLWLLTEPFERHQAKIANSCVLNDDLRGQWLSLIQTLHPKNRSKVAQTAKDSIGKLYKTHRNHPEDIRRTLSQCGNVLASWHEGIYNKLPQNVVQAQACVRAFLCEARTRHDEVGFPVWNRFTRAFNQTSSGVSPFLTFSAAEWREAQAFLEGHIFNILAALHILSGPHRLENPHAAMALARDAFHYAQMSVDDAARGAEWTKVLGHTLTRSVEWLFADNRARVIGKGDAPAQEGIIDRMLLEVVQEPVGLLLHILTFELVERFPLELDLDPQMKKINPQRRLSFPLAYSVRMLIREMWKEADRIPLIWDKQIHTLRRVFGLIVGNIAHHGDPASPCTVTIRLMEEAGESKLALSVSNLTRKSNTPGDGNGHMQIARLIESMGGVFKSSIIDMHFACDLLLPVEIMSLEEKA